MTLYGHYTEYGLPICAYIWSVTFSAKLTITPRPLAHFSPVPYSLCTYESPRKPSGSCCPASGSTSVSRILVSTCSDGSSVRIFFFPRMRPTRITRPQNLCVPYASAVTYARWPARNLETSPFFSPGQNPGHCQDRHRETHATIPNLPPFE